MYRCTLVLRSLTMGNPSQHLESFYVEVMPSPDLLSGGILFLICIPINLLVPVAISISTFSIRLLSNLKLGAQALSGVLLSQQSRIRPRCVLSTKVPSYQSDFSPFSWQSKSHNIIRGSFNLIITNLSSLIPSKEAPPLRL